MTDRAGNGDGLAPADLFRAQQHARVLESCPKDHVIILALCAPLDRAPTGEVGYRVDHQLSVAASPEVATPAGALIMAAAVKTWSDAVWNFFAEQGKRLIQP